MELGGFQHILALNTIFLDTNTLFPPGPDGPSLSEQRRLFETMRDEANYLATYLEPIVNSTHRMHQLPDFTLDSDSAFDADDSMEALQVDTDSSERRSTQAETDSPPVSQP